MKSDNSANDFNLLFTGCFLQTANLLLPCHRLVYPMVNEIMVNEITSAESLTNVDKGDHLSGVVPRHAFDKYNETSVV